MTEHFKELNEALPDILIADGIYLVIGEIVIFLFIPNPLIYAVGFLSGVIYAVFAVIHMSFGIRKVVYGRANQRKTMILGYLLRLLVMVILFAVLYCLGIGDLLAALVGMFAMKISAYVRPVFHTITSKIPRKGGSISGEHDDVTNGGM